MNTLVNTITNAPRRSSILLLAASGLLAACTGEQGGATKTTGRPSVAAGESAAAAAGAAGAPDTGGIPGIPGLGGGGAMDQMHAHMAVMEGRPRQHEGDAARAPEDGRQHDLAAER